MYIDAHSHIDFYQAELPQALAQIAEHRILTISNSMDLPSYQANLAIAAQCPLVIPTFGIHPWKAHEYADQLTSLDNYISSSPMIGEIGLDYYFVKDSALFPAQRVVFEYFINGARRQGKIVNLHTKGAEQDILAILKEHEMERVIIHWYSGPIKVLKKMIAQGWYFTVGVEVLSSHHIEKVARTVPVEQLLTELDNPGGIKWINGELGMPVLIVEVVKKIAALKGLPKDRIKKIVCENFLRLVSGDERLKKLSDMISTFHHKDTENN